MLLKVILAFACLAPASLNGLRILAVFPYTGKSHHYVFEPLLQQLLAKGHDLTVISHFPDRNAPQNRKDIHIVKDMSKSENAVDLSEFESIPRFMGFMQTAFEGDFLYSVGVEMCHALLTNDGVKELIEKKAEFDVALIEQFNSDCLLGLIHKLGVPSVGITSDTLMPWHFDRFGIPTNPSFVPCHHQGYGIKPNFLQTVSSFITCAALRLGYDMLSTNPTQDILKQYLGNDLPPLNDMVNNISALLVNSYYATHGGILLPPNVIEVGGLHLKKTHNKLPQDIEKFINESPHGVIFFSLGSMIKASSLSEEKLKAIQDTFATIPQRVLWKWENETMAGISKNVLVKKWLPQFDILNHENVKAFISHAGMLSTTEAAHCGVPMISIPIFGDQFANAGAAKDSGLGVVLNYRDLTKETLSNAINTVLSTKMQESALKVSAVFRDRPQPPLETAVYWIEHVARHGGAHLRPASADIPLYKYLLLDVLSFLAVIGFIVFVFMYKILICILNSIFTRSQKRKKD